MSQIGDRTRTIRERNGYSQEYVARAADVSTSTIQRLETGRNVPSLDTLIRVAAALDVSLGDLVNGEGVVA
jgi:transcriptional regulator with XRE-family HTH domain